MRVAEDHEPYLRRFSREEYDRVVATGIFDSEHVELLDGVIVRMTPSGPLHAGTIDLLAEELAARLIGRARIRQEKPFAATEDAEPEPDIAVVPPGDYRDAHPSRAFLVVEVADSSLVRDRSVKPATYARAGVPEYWVVNLVDRLVEVHTGIDGGAYTTVTPRSAGDSIALVAFPDVTVAVSAFLR